MEYILEFFDFFNKKKPEPELNNWKDKAEYVYSKFKEIKEKKPKDYFFLSGEVKANNYDISYNSYDKKRVNIHLFFKVIKDGYEVIDFNDINIKNKQGHYKITKEEYDKYIKYAEDISNYLDAESEKNHNKSTSFLDSEGEIHIDKSDLVIDELNYELEDKLFNKYIGKEFEFELGYNLWSSTSTNEKIVERKKLKIGNIKVNLGGNRFYMTIETIGVLGEKCSIWIEPTTKAEYFDVSTKFRKLSDIIKMNVVKPELTRKQEREKIETYPNIIWYDLSPSKYDTIEFIKEMTELLTELTSNIK